MQQTDKSVQAASSQSRLQQTKKPINNFLYTLIIISFLDTFVQLPIISPYAQELGADSLLIGLIIGMYSFSNMLSNVVAGYWIDRFGRKKIMFLGMVIAGVSLILYTFVATGIQLMWARFVHGIGGGLLIPAVFAYLGDRTEGQQKGKTMALSGAAIGIAAIVGPALGGTVKAFLGINWVFVLIAILLLGAAVLVYFFLPDRYAETRKELVSTATHKQNSSCSKQNTFKHEQDVKVGEIWPLLKHSQLASAYLSSFGMMFALGILTYMLPLKVELLGFSSATTGLLLSSYGIMAIIIFVLPLNRLSDRIGRMKPMVAGLTIISCSLVWLGLTSQLWLLIAGMLLYGTGFGLLFPAMSALIIDHTQEKDRGKAFGLFYAFFSLGVVIGPFVVGWLSFPPNPSLMLGSAIIIGLILTLLYIQKDKKENITSRVD